MGIMQRKISDRRIYPSSACSQLCTSGCRYLAVVLLAAMLVASLFGCGKKEKVTKLIFVSWGNEREEKSLRGLLDDFEKMNPGIKVEMWITPHARMFDKLMISTAGGRPPDVSRVSSLWFHACAAKGLFEPLDSYVKRDNFDIDDFYPQCIEGWGKYRGVLYSIPTDCDVYAVYYNKDMFDKYKLPYPDWDWDWQKYLRVARALTRDLNGDGKLDQWGTSTDQFWSSYVYQNGGTILSPDLRTCTLDRPEAYGGIQWISDLINKYHVSPNAEERAQVGALNLFASGKLGMYISGSWAAELQFKDLIKDFTYDVGPLPKGKYRVTANEGAAYAVLRLSRHKEEAWKLVKWMTGKEYQRRAAVNSQIIPSRRSVAESGAYLKLNKPPKRREVFLQMIRYGRAQPPVAVAPEMNEIIGAEVSLAILGKKSAKEACMKVKPVIDQLLRHQD